MNGWRTNAACRRLDGELFFPVSSRGPDYEIRVAEAKRVCRGCPVRSDCLDYALTIRPQGIWGGTTEDERRNLARRIQRAAKQAS